MSHDEARALELEAKALADYKAHLGKVVEIEWVQGYIGDDSRDFKCRPAAKVRICETKEDSILHWNDEWLDPYWEVELVESHPQLKDARSFWINACSYNIKTGQPAPANMKVIDDIWPKKIPKTPIPQEVRNQVVAAWREIHKGVHFMLALYTAYPELNNVQPASIEHAIPSCIEEWNATIFAHIEDWESVPVMKKAEEREQRNRRLVKELKAKYEKYNGWLFDLEYPGYFVYYKGPLSLYFTPDYDGDEGELCINIQHENGIEPPENRKYGKNVKYEHPLTAEQMVGATKRVMDGIDKDNAEKK